MLIVTKAAVGLEGPRQKRDTADDTFALKSPWIQLWAQTDVLA